ncbi:hypothetical protein ACHQM5_013761 [Ranunculus cassubicifolius]
MKLFFCVWNRAEEFFWSSAKVADDRSEPNSEDSCLPAEAKKLSMLLKMPPCVRFGFNCVSSGTKIFVLGGSRSGKEGKAEYSDDVYMTDTSVSSPQWKKLPSMKVQRNWAAAAVVDGRVYVMGTMWKRQIPKPWGEFLDTNKIDDWDWEPMPSLLQMLEDDYRAKRRELYPDEVFDDDHEEHVSIYDTKSIAVMSEGSEKRIFLGLGCPRINRCVVSFDVNAARWDFHDVTFCQCSLGMSREVKNVILDGTLFMFSSGCIVAYDLGKDKKVAHLPFRLDGWSHGGESFLFHLGNGDMCLVLQGPGSINGSEIWCQYFHLSHLDKDHDFEIVLGLLEKYMVKGKLCDCLLV